MKDVPVGLRLVTFVGLVTAAYGSLGSLMPQHEIQPPPVPVQEGAPEGGSEGIPDLVRRGREIFEGKGTCTACHSVGEGSGDSPFPDLAGIGARAAERVPGLDAVAYLTQSLYSPGAFVVEGFAPVMPPVDEPPVNLAEDEALAVVAFLQSLGGEPTVGPGEALPTARVNGAGADFPAPAAGGVVEAGSAVALESSQRPAGAGGGGEPGGGEAEGDRLYAERCAACHGERGEGDPVLNAPRIAGMEPWYLARQVRNFASGARGAHPEDTFGRPMQVVAKTLDQDREIDAIAEYVGGLR